MRHDIFESPPRPHIYVAFGARFSTIMTFHVRTAPGISETAMLAAMRRELQALDRSSRFSGPGR